MLHFILVNLVIPAVLVAGYPPARGQKPQVAPDHSLAVATYIQKGLPANDRGWSADDYLQAAKVLKAIAGVDATQLPRYGSPISGAVFARIVSRENFKLFGNDLLSHQQHFIASSGLLQGLGQILIVYATATTQERIFDSELIELMRYVLELSREVVRLADAFAASLPADDPNHDSRMKGREQMREGMARVVTGCLSTITEREAYRSSELVRLAQTLDATVPDIFPFLPPGVQQELNVRIQRMAEDEPNSGIKERLIHLVTTLSKAKPR